MEKSKNQTLAKQNNEIRHLQKCSAEVIKAKQGKLIAECNDQELDQLFANIFLLIGVSEKNALSDQQWSFLSANIRAIHGRWTKQEVILAFNLALQGKLTDVELSLYDKPFNLDYLSKIMNAYRRYKSPKICDYNSLNLDSIKQTIPDNKQREQINRQNAINCFERYVLKGVIFDPGGTVFNFLSKKKVIKLTPEQVEQFKQLSIARHKMDLEQSRERSRATGMKAESIKIGDCIKNYQSFSDTDKGKSELRIIYKELVVKRLFESLIELKKHIKEYL